MKLQDPTLPYKAVVDHRRRSRAEADGERFRLGVHGLDCGPVPGSSDRTALIGASAWALKSEQLETSLGYIGLVSGLLTDLGFKVCPIGALSERPGTPALVAWVCGDETLADEYGQLADIPAPGLSIGSCVDGLDHWGYVEPDDHPDELEFISSLVAGIRALVGGEVPALTATGFSTVPSTVRSGTVRHGQVHEETSVARSPSSEAQDGTHRHGAEPGSSGS